MSQEFEINALAPDVHVCIMTCGFDCRAQNVSSGICHTVNYVFANDNRLCKTAHVASLQPNSGPLPGGTEVSVLGTGFLNAPGISCKFEARQANAVWKSSSWVMCVTPPMDANLFITVEISNNGQDYTIDGVTFTYKSAAVTLQLRPSTGPTKGQTRVTLVGAHFAHAPQFTCKFSDITVPALAVVNSSAAVCGVPASAKVECVGFSASNNGVDFSSNLLLFCYIGNHSFDVSKPLCPPAPPFLVRSYRHELLLCGGGWGDGEGLRGIMSLQNSLFDCIFSLSVWQCTNSTIFFRGNPGNSNSAFPWPARRADINHTHRIWLPWHPIRSNRALSLHI